MKVCELLALLEELDEIDPNMEVSIAYQPH